MISIQRLSLAALAAQMGAKASVPPPAATALNAWQMERDDGPIFRFFYQHFQPRRHLEFGTWQGFGTCLCLESAPATVWTINLPNGETKADGSWAYSQRFGSDSPVPFASEQKVFGNATTGPVVFHRTDSQGFIGRYYREKNLGHRVCQILCDSRVWDNSAYPPDFFDTALIDGGHHPETVVSDTRKALAVLRPGGLILWHDYCPVPDIGAKFESVRGVTGGIEQLMPELSESMKSLVWIDPSWILAGIKK